MQNEIQILRRHITDWGISGYSACFIWAIICFGLDIFHFNLTIDDELVAFKTTPNVTWISQGRWAMYVWNALLFPDGLVPIIPQVIAVIFLVLSATLIASLIGPPNRILALIVAGLFIANPVHVLLLSFSSAQYGLYIGLFCAVSSVVVLALTEGTRSVIVSALLGAIAIGTYQPHATLMAALSIGVIIARFSDPAISRGSLAAWARSFLIRAVISLLVAFVIYKLIDHIVLTLSHAPVDEYYERYASRMLPSLSDQLKWLYNAIYHYYWAGTGLEDRFSIFLYDLLFGLAVVSIVARPVGTFRRIIGVCGLFILALIPIGLEFALASPIPARSHAAFPAVVAINASLALVLRQHAFRGVVILILCVLLFRSASIDNKLILSEQLTTQADRDEINKIVETVNQLDGVDALPKPIPLTFVGELVRPANELYRQVDVVGGSFLAWQENPWRIDAFMRTMGITQFRAIDREEWQQIKAKTLDMNSWPAKGSIRIVDGVVTVRLGPQ